MKNKIYLLFAALKIIYVTNKLLGSCGRKLIPGPNLRRFVRIT